MEVPVGSLSHDGWWMWDGARWVPAVSPNGAWRWNGLQWIALGRPRTLWQPPWMRTHTIALGVWLLPVPAVLAIATIALVRLRHLTPIGGLLAASIAFEVWAFIGGTIVRPHGRWWEVLAIAGALIALLLLIDIAALIATPDQPGTDDGAGLGMGFLVFVVFPVTMLPVALGRGIRRAIQHRDRQP